MEALPQHRFRWWEKGLLWLLALSFFGLIATQVWGFVADILRERRAEQGIAWKQVTAADEGFSAEFPGSPTRSSTGNRTTYKVEHALYTASVAVTTINGNGGAYVDATVGRIRDGRTNVVLERDVLAGTVWGREIHTMGAARNVTIYQVYSVGDRLYEVQFVHLSTAMDDVHRQFLKSIRFH